MRTGRGAIGVIGIDSDKPGPSLTPDQRRLLDALADQGALAIERVQLVEDMERVQPTAETERLRAALLTSISHDLKTPLASVIGSAGTLRDFGSKLTDSEKVELLSTVIEESERLNRFIVNLLDMTRLESGAVTPKLAPHDLSEIIGSTLQRSGRVEGNITAQTAVHVDDVLLANAKVASDGYHLIRTQAIAAIAHRKLGHQTEMTRQRAHFVTRLQGALQSFQPDSSARPDN